MFRSPVVLIGLPRKFFVTALQSNLRFDIDFTVMGGSRIVLLNA